MRDIPEAMAARIESGAATLCHGWIVERTDGERLGFTDHDPAGSGRTLLSQWRSSASVSGGARRRGRH